MKALTGLEGFEVSRRIRRTLFIGLGGTGCQAVLHCKRRFMEVYGEIPRAVVFLAMDTVPRPDKMTVSDGRQVKFDPSEYLHLRVDNPSALVKANAEVRDWFPDNVQIRVISNGAGAVRSIGRLALYGNTSEVRNILYSKLREVRAFEVDQQAGWEVEGTDTVVTIVSSLAGGTGSGIFLDVADLVVSSGLMGQSDEMYGYFLMPDAFLGKPGTDRVQANGYAALKELDAAMSRKHAHLLRFGGRQYKIETNPFDFLLLVNNRNRENITFTNLNDVLEFMGTAMWVSTTATGQQARAVWDNIRNQTLGPDAWLGKNPLYSSFGVSEMVFPRDFFTELFAVRGALSIAEEMLGAKYPSRQAGEAVDRFVEEMGLAPEKILSGLVDQEIPRMPLPAQVSPAQARAVLSTGYTNVRHFERQVKEDAGDEVDSIKESVRSSLFAALQDSLANEAPVVRTLDFLGRLLVRLGEFKEKAVSDREAADTRLQRVRAQHLELENALEKAERRRFGRAQALKKVTVDAASFANSECRSILSYHLADKAVYLYEHASGLVETERNRLLRLSNALEVVKGGLENQLEALLATKSPEKPFLIEVRPEKLLEHPARLAYTDFWGHLQREKLALLPGPGQGEQGTLLSMSTTELRDYLHNFALCGRHVQDVKGKTIEDALQELPAERIVDYVYRLSLSASPLWGYNKGLVASERTAHSFCVFAVPDAQRSLLDEEIVRSAMGGSREYPIVSVSDPTRIVCFKVEASVPAFVLHGMARYKDAYLVLELEPSGVTTHTSRNMAGEALPDLYPLDFERSRIRTWALALALPGGWTGSGTSGNLVFRSGHHYYVRSDKKGPSGTFRLAQGRAEAYREFVKDDDLAEEISQKVAQIVRGEGETSVMATVESYVKSLQEELGKVTEESLKGIVSKEIDALKDWLRAESTLL